MNGFSEMGIPGDSAARRYWQLMGWGEHPADREKRERAEREAREEEAKTKAEEEKHKRLLARGDAVAVLEELGHRRDEQIGKALRDAQLASLNRMADEKLNMLVESKTICQADVLEERRKILEELAAYYSVELPQPRNPDGTFAEKK